MHNLNNVTANWIMLKKAVLSQPYDIYIRDRHALPRIFLEHLKSNNSFIHLFYVILTAYAAPSKDFFFRFCNIFFLVLLSYMS